MSYNYKLSSSSLSESPKIICEALPSGSEFVCVHADAAFLLVRVQFVCELPDGRPTRVLCFQKVQLQLLEGTGVQHALQQLFLDFPFVSPHSLYETMQNVQACLKSLVFNSTPRTG